MTTRLPFATQFRVVRAAVLVVIVLAAFAGPAALQTRAAQGPLGFTSANGISIPDGDFTPASEYPTTINVNGFTEPGAVVDSVTVQLSGLTSGEEADNIDMMLVGPDGSKSIILSDVGGDAALTGASITLSDTAEDFMPASTALPSGTYQPTNNGSLDQFPAPAPDAVDAGATLGVFRGINPNGAWKLFVVDDDYSDSGAGSLASWTLTIKTTVPPAIATSPGTTKYTVTAPPVVVDPGVTLTDADSTSLDGGSLSAEFPEGGGPLDDLDVRNQGTGAGQIGVVGANVTYEGNLIGAILPDTALESVLRIDLNAAASPAAAQALARNIVYSTNVLPPSNRVVQFTFEDGDGGIDSASKTIVFVESPLLRIRKAGNGQGIVRGASGGINCGEDCFEQVTLGKVVSLTAIPAADSLFTGWRGCKANGRTCKVTMGANATVVATFVRPRCEGLPATRAGSGVINGTAGADVIVGSAGADTINGRGGDDLICGLGGADRITAGGGDDQVFGGAGADNISGGRGDDVLSGEGGPDVITGGAGDDTMVGGAGRDRCTGNAGNDKRITCEAGVP